MTNSQKTIAIIGLGYVGLPLAVEFGKHLSTIGFDINQARIAELQSGKDHTLECSPDELKASKNLRYSSDIQDLNQAQIYIVTVPTPVDQANRPDMTPLIKASETVGKVLKAGDIVIYESTVYPGATEEVCVPVLEKFSGFKFNKDFFCGYSPERINPGDKVNTLTKIRKITSGSTPAVAGEVDALYNSIIKAGTWKASSIKVAEAAKVIENSQRDLNIAFVNELSVNPAIHFLVVGDGDLREHYQTKYGHLSNLTFAPKVPKRMVQSVLAKCDLLYFAVHVSAVWRFGQSLNKVIDYMLAGKPIVASYTGYSSMINEAGCGTYVPAGDLSKLRAEIARYRELSNSERNAVGAKGRNWILEHRNFQALARDYLAILFPGQEH
jgi:hypothetical protein